MRRRVSPVSSVYSSDSIFPTTTVSKSVYFWEIERKKGESIVLSGAGMSSRKDKREWGVEGKEG